MLLRMIVEQYVRKTARDQLYGAAREALRQSSDEAAGEGETEAPPPPCRIGFVFALGIESGGLVDKLSETTFRRLAGIAERTGSLDGQRIALVQSGVGRRQAARATELLIQAHNPEWIVSAGFAGALSPELRRGHVLMADEVMDVQGNQLSVGLRVEKDSVAGNRSLHIGRLLTVDELVRTKQHKEQLGTTHGALACDMETMAVAEVCRDAGIGCLSVRVISDAFEDELPPEIEKLMHQKSLAGKLGAAAGAVFRRPSAVKDMWQLQEDALRASDRLARFLEGVVPQLAPRDA